MAQTAIQTSSDKKPMFTKAFSTFSVNDLQKAKAFYGETLGLKINDEKVGFGLEFEDGPKLFIYPKANHEPATFTVLNFSVDAISPAVEQLAAVGIKFESYEGEMKTDENGICWGKRAGGHGPNIAWFKDPAGNFLSVVEA
ncbi:MAG: VOC family protein [Acidobacteriota bacterium]